MVLVISHKVEDELLTLQTTDSAEWFAHYLNEVLAFDRMLPPKFGYPLNSRTVVLEGGVYTSTSPSPGVSPALARVLAVDVTL